MNQQSLYPHASLHKVVWCCLITNVLLNKWSPAAVSSFDLFFVNAVYWFVLVSFGLLCSTVHLPKLPVWGSEMSWPSNY